MAVPFVINEHTTGFLTVEFLDKTGSIAAPTSATYTVHDVDSGAEIRTSTVIASIAGSVELTLNKGDNTVQNTGLKFEKRRVSVIAIYGAADELNDDFIYYVRNLRFVT